MDETSPLLGVRTLRQEPQCPDSLPPNLMPRHRELIPTPCGPVKQCSELSPGLKVYFGFSVVFLLALVGITSYNISKQHKSTDVTFEDNFTVSLVQLIGLLFCLYYVCRGVLQANPWELLAFVVNTLLLLLRSLVIFFNEDSQGQQGLLVRFSLVICLGLLLIPCTVYFTWKHEDLAFRWEGALAVCQKKYRLKSLCFSAVIFDLQAQVDLCILILTLDFPGHAYNIIAGGVALAIVVTAVGATALIKKWFEDQTLILEAVAVVTVIISLLFKVVLICGHCSLMRLLARVEELPSSPVVFLRRPSQPDSMHPAGGSQAQIV